MEQIHNTQREASKMADYYHQVEVSEATGGQRDVMEKVCINTHTSIEILHGVTRDRSGSFANRAREVSLERASQAKRFESLANKSAIWRPIPIPAEDDTGSRAEGRER
jgi:hypothetical protein